jgi:hypothetical protein
VPQDATGGAAWLQRAVERERARAQQALLLEPPGSRLRALQRAPGEATEEEEEQTPSGSEALSTAGALGRLRELEAAAAADSESEPGARGAALLGGYSEAGLESTERVSQWPPPSAASAVRRPPPHGPAQRRSRRNAAASAARRPQPPAARAVLRRARGQASEGSALPDSASSAQGWSSSALETSDFTNLLSDPPSPRRARARRARRARRAASRAALEPPSGGFRVVLPEEGTGSRPLNRLAASSFGTESEAEEGARRPRRPRPRLRRAPARPRARRCVARAHARADAPDARRPHLASGRAPPPGGRRGPAALWAARLGAARRCARRLAV